MMATPGHTAKDIATLATTGDGPTACTHLWWTQEGPQTGPLAEDQALLERSRGKLLDLAPALIIPGHGAPFSPAR